MKSKRTISLQLRKQKIHGHIMSKLGLEKLTETEKKLDARRDDVLIM